MECKGIKEKLCAYLEGVASPQEVRIIEEHLPLCPECRKNLADLKKTGELVKDLAELEPPAWLTPQIMSRIRAEEEKKKGILHKLFYPLHIKIPAQALATGCIAVIAVFVFRAVEPEMKLTQFPSPAQQLPPQEEAKVALQPPQVSKSDSTLKRSTLKDEAAREPARAPAISPSAALPQPAAEPLRAEKRQVAEEQVGKGEGIALPRVAQETQDRKSLSAAPRFPEAATLKLKPAHVLVKVPDVRVAGGKVEELFRQQGIRNIERESREGREILTAELTAVQVKEFLEKLQVVGEVSDKDLPGDASSGNVIIRVEIITIP